MNIEEDYYRPGKVSRSLKTVQCFKYGDRFSIQYCRKCGECRPIFPRTTSKKKRRELLGLG